MTSQPAGIGTEIRTDIPCRLDRQRWSRFHSLVALALGVTWILDELEVTLAGAGIGGEYTAINSTIQELIPARYRGWSDLAINGTFWVGAAMAASPKPCVCEFARRGAHCFTCIASARWSA